MITPEHVQTMAVYNRWQNQSIYGAADQLSDADRRQDRGAFFRSIHETLTHILWGDAIWMTRFAETEMPEAAAIADWTNDKVDWTALKAQRVDFDEIIISWSKTVSDDWLAGDLSFHSKALGRHAIKPAGFCVTHFFNHQTHHRGQVHALLTATGAKPDDTDLFLMKTEAWNAL